jgi:RDD family
MKLGRWSLALPPAVTQPLRERQRWITPEPLNLAPELVGLPLATPLRRAIAMALDLAVVGMLTGISGAWLWAGLALVLLQLHNRPRHAPPSRRQWVGWAAVALIALLALDEAHDRWTAWRATAAVAAAGQAVATGPDLDDDEDAEPAVAADAADAASASASAAAPPSDAERIAQLESQLATAKKETRKVKRALAEKPAGLRAFVSGLLDDIGAGLGWGIVYFSLLPAWWGGQTVGKKLMRLRVLELTGKPMTVMRSLKRYGGYAAGLATGGVGFLQLLWDPNRQGLHDKAAHTVVVDLRLPRAPASPPGPELQPPV